MIESWLATGPFYLPASVTVSGSGPGVVCGSICWTD